MLDRDGYAKLVDMGSAEIGPSNVLQVVEKFVCYWTSFVKLQCRDIWQFAKTVQEMVENKVYREVFYFFGLCWTSVILFLLKIVNILTFISMIV